MRKLTIRVAAMVLAAVLVAVALVGSGWLEKRDDGVTAPLLIRQQALAAAKQQNKRLWLWFTARYAEVPGIDYPALMEQFHADPEVARILSKYFFVQKIDIERDFGGMQVYLDSGQLRGVPAFTLLDSSGKFLADSGDDQTTNIGFPDTPEQRDAYQAAIQRACPEMTAAELALLRQKLMAILASQEAPAKTESSSPGC